MTFDKNMKNTIIALWCALIAYFTFMYIPAVNGAVLSPDLSILTAFAGRMLDGYKFTEAYYETNPPLNIMVYVPVVWLSRISDIPLWDMHFYYSLFWVLLSFAMTALIMPKITFLEAHWKHLLMMCFIITAFMTPSKSFGDRDHLVFLYLVPFTLVQLDMMGAKALPRWLSVPTLALGAFMILLKPHYGILPTILLATRIAKKRSPKFLIEGDFLALSIAVISYALMLWLYFPDFVTIVLPDTIKLYASNPHPMVKFEVIAYALMVMLCIMAAYEFKLEGKQKQLCLFLCLCTLILLIPYTVQGKGLLYHRIGFVSFFYTSVAFTIYFLVSKYAARFVKSHIAPGILILIVMFLCLTFNGMPDKTLSDEEFPQYPVSKKLIEHCDEPCSFLMLYDYSDLIHQLQVYHNAFHASRFTSFWFLPLILQSEYQIGIGEEPPLPPEEIKRYKDKYINMIADDMERFKPDIIFDFKDYYIMDEDAFDFIEYLADNPRFAAQMQHYQMIDTLTLERNIYYKGFNTPFDEEGPVRFDIYKRID